MLGAGQVAEDLAAIERLSLVGNSIACRLPGMLLLRGDYILCDIVAARHWLGNAADAGDEQALRAEIALSANGSGTAVSWRVAPDRVRQLAQKDSAAAAQAEHIATLDIDADD